MSVAGAMTPAGVGCSAIVPLQTPIANSTTIAASSTHTEPVLRTAKNTARPAADPKVPGATGTYPR